MWTTRGEETLNYARPIGLLTSLALALVFPLWADSATTSMAIFTLIFAGMATGWNMFSGYTGYISLGHMVYYGLGAYTLAIACQDWHIPGGSEPLLLLPLAGLVAGGCAIPLGWIALRTRRHTFMVITIAIFFLFQVLAYNLPVSNGSAGLFLPNPPWSAQVFDFPFYYVALLYLLSALAVSRWLRFSKFGLLLLAIRDDEDRARSLGVKTGPLKLSTYVLSAFFLGLAGALSAYFIGLISPLTVFDPSYNVVIIVMVFLGGVGTLTGPLLGTALLEPLQQFLTVQFGAIPGLNLIVYGLPPPGRHPRAARGRCTGAAAEAVGPDRCPQTGPRVTQGHRARAAGERGEVDRRVQNGKLAPRHPYDRSRAARSPSARRSTIRAYKPGRRGDTRDHAAL